MTDWDMHNSRKLTDKEKSAGKDTSLKKPQENQTMEQIRPNLDVSYSRHSVRKRCGLILRNPSTTRGPRHDISTVIDDVTYYDTREICNTKLLLLWRYFNTQSC